MRSKRGARGNREYGPRSHRRSHGKKLELATSLAEVLGREGEASPAARKQLASDLAKIRQGAEINRVLLHDAYDMVLQVRVRPEPKATYDPRACAARAATAAANVPLGRVAK